MNFLDLQRKILHAEVEVKKDSTIRWRSVGRVTVIVKENGLGEESSNSGGGLFAFHLLSQW